MKKDWLQFLLCFLLSAAVWLIHNMSQSYVNLVSIPVLAKSNIDAHSDLSTTDATVTAQVRASGFRHFVLSKRHRRPVTVSFTNTDFRHAGEDRYYIPSSALYKYVSSFFGDGATVESFVSDGLTFTFPSTDFKKVPVVCVHSLDYKSQYMAVSAMSVQPDSVYVYGEPSRLENVDRVLTRPVELHELDADAHGTVKLEVPRGVRLSGETVKYSLNVSRYVEIRREVKIGTRNVPSGVSLSVLPSTASVVIRCSFPVGADPDKNASFYVDYNDFTNSITGRCVVKVSGLPSGVMDYTVSPEVIDCFIDAK